MRARTRIPSQIFPPSDGLAFHLFDVRSLRLNFRRCVGFTLLHGAVRFGNPTALSILLASGATYILERDKAGKTPFDWAILNSEPGMLTMMLDCAAAGNTKMPNLQLALKNADTQVEAAERSGTKVAEATETRAVLLRLIEEAERKRKAEEAAAAAAAAEARRLLEEEIERAAKAEADRAAAAAAKEAEDRRLRLEAEAQARLEEEARLREEERRRREQEEEEEEARRNARDAKTQMIHFNGLVESSLLRRGIGRDAPIIAIRVRPLSAREFAADPVNILGDADGNPFDISDAPGEGRLAPGPSQQYTLGPREFSCNALMRDRDEVYGTPDVQYNDADQLNSYMMVGGTIIDSMTKGTNSTVIVCGSRGAGKTYTVGRPFHAHPFERDEYDETKRRWSTGKLIRSDDSGLVERTGRDLMSYRTVLQAMEPTAKLYVAMSCFVIYQEKIYDLLAKTRADVLSSSTSLKVVGQEVKAGAQGRGIFVQGLTPRAIAGEGPVKKGKGAKEKSVRGWLMMADTNRRNLAKDLKAGDDGLRRAACVTMFEILQISEVKQEEEKKARRRPGRETLKKGGGDNQMLFSSVTIVDLPGAVSKPADDGTKKKEDVAITKMLHCLSDCVEKLAEQQRHKGKKLVIPWRNSKLTMLLRDKIGGNNLTLMIGAISPTMAELANSERTLIFLKICGDLRQPPIEEREANVQVVDVEEMSQEEKEAREKERAAKKARKEEIKKERKAKRDRGEKVYDDETGEELEDDDDLDDDDGGQGFGGLLDDPTAIMKTMDDLGGDGSSAPDKQKGTRLKAHAIQRKKQLADLPEQAVIQSIVGGFPGHGKFHQRMMGLDSSRLNHLKRLREKEARRLQLLTELRKLLQAYSNFERRHSNEKALAMRAKLKKVFSGSNLAQGRRRGRGKFLNAFDKLSGGKSPKAARAWTTAQLHLIKERCDELASTHDEMGSLRHELTQLLKQMHEALAEQRYEILDELQGAALEDSDESADSETLETQLHDLGLLTMHVEAEMDEISTSSSTDLLLPTIDESKQFGEELHREINDVLDALQKRDVDEASEAPTGTSLLGTKIRAAASLIGSSSEEIDDLELNLDDETAARRREGLELEASMITALIDPSASLPPPDPSVALTPAEAEMNRMAKGLSDAILAILERTQAHRAEDMRTLEERLERARAPLAPEPIFRRRPRQVATVAAGECHTMCVRQADGVAFSWGGSTPDAQGAVRLSLLGQGQMSGTSCVRIPTPIVGLDGTTVREVAAGMAHSLLLGADGRVWSFGNGKHGALGHGNLADVASPKSIADLSQVQAEQVAAGDFHSLVLSSDGHVYSFGWGAAGRLGHGDRAPQQRPLQVSALAGTKICQVSAGNAHSLAVGEEGELYSWGFWDKGRLGLGDALVENQYLPARVKLPRRVRIWHASAGGSHSLAVASDGTLYSFGNGGRGRLGHGDDADCWTPTLVTALEGTPVRHAEAGMAQSVVHTEAGVVLTFGCNHEGWLGDADQENRLLPTPVAVAEGLAPVEDVASGAYHTVVMLANGELRAFGSNKCGQLGSESNSEAGAEPGAMEPVPVELPL